MPTNTTKTLIRGARVLTMDSDDDFAADILIDGDWTPVSTKNPPPSAGFHVTPKLTYAGLSITPNRYS